MHIVQKLVVAEKLEQSTIQTTTGNIQAYIQDRCSSSSA